MPRRHTRRGLATVLVASLMLIVFLAVPGLASRVRDLRRGGTWRVDRIWAEEVARSAIEEAAVLAARTRMREALADPELELRKILEPTRTRALVGSREGLELAVVEVVETFQEQLPHPPVPAGAPVPTGAPPSRGLLRFQVIFARREGGALRPALRFEALRTFNVLPRDGRSPRVEVSREDLVWESRRIVAGV